MNLSRRGGGRACRAAAVLSAPGALLPTRRIDARLTLLPGAVLKHGARVRVHHGTAEALARVSVAGPSGAVAPGGTADARLRFETAAVVTRGDRFIVRSYSPLVTIGGGVVLESAAAAGRRAHGPRRGPDGGAPAHADPGDDVRAAIRVMVGEAGLAGVAAGALRAARRAPRGEALTAALHALTKAGVLLVGGDVGRRRPGRARAGGGDVVRAGDVSSEQSARRRESARSGARPVVRRPAAGGVREIVAELVAAGTVTATDTLALASHRVTLSPEETQVYEWLDRRFAAAGYTPPDAAALAAESRRAPALVERVVQLMVKQKRLIRVDTLVFHRDVLERLKQEVAARKAAGGGAATVDVKSFKDTYDVSRKFAIPLLEYLDRERVTRRAGEVRIVL